MISILNDSEGGFHKQHDARFQPDAGVSLYDDQPSHPGLAARGVEYHVNTADGTATLVWSFQSPDGENSLATGSFRRLYGGMDNVIGWGDKPDTLFTEVDAAGNVLLKVTFANGEIAYRFGSQSPANNCWVASSCRTPRLRSTHVPPPCEVNGNRGVFLVDGRSAVSGNASCNGIAQSTSAAVKATSL